MFETVSLFDAMEHDNTQRRVASRRALALAHTRVERNLGAFLRGARSEEEFAERLGLLQDEFAGYVTSAANEVGHEHPEHIAAALTDHYRLAAGVEFKQTPAEEQEEDEEDEKREASASASCPPLVPEPSSPRWGNVKVLAIVPPMQGQPQGAPMPPGAPQGPPGALGAPGVPPGAGAPPGAPGAPGAALQGQPQGGPMPPGVPGGPQQGPQGQLPGQPGMMPQGPQGLPGQPIDPRMGKVAGPGPMGPGAMGPGGPADPWGPHDVQQMCPQCGSERFDGMRCPDCGYSPHSTPPPAQQSMGQQGQDQLFQQPGQLFASAQNPADQNDDSSRLVTCPECGGDGKTAGATKCAKCAGKGKVPNFGDTVLDALSSTESKCSKCGATMFDGNCSNGQCSNSSLDYRDNDRKTSADEQNNTGLGGPEPKMDKGKGSPSKVDVPDGKWHTEEIDVVEPIKATNEGDLSNIGDIKTESLPSETENAGFQTGGEDSGPHTKTFGDGGQANPVTHETFSSHNPLSDLLTSEFPPDATVNEALLSM